MTPEVPVDPVSPFGPGTVPAPCIKARVVVLKSVGRTPPFLIALLVTAPGAISQEWMRPVAAAADPPSATNNAAPAIRIEGDGQCRRLWLPGARIFVGTAPLLLLIWLDIGQLLSFVRAR